MRNDMLNDDETSAVQFLRLEPDSAIITGIRGGNAASLRIGGLEYPAEAGLPDSQQRALAAELDWRIYVPRA